jgi:hypothetical protein
LVDNFIAILTQFGSTIMTRKIIDPSNSNNNISDDMTPDEKTGIRNAATNSLNQQYWENIIW